MALSEREQQVLRDLEKQLHADDPSLAGSMRPAGGERRPSPRHIGAGVALLLVGLSVVIGGVAVGHGIVSILVGLGGFALAVWGVSLMLTTVEQGGADGGAASGSGRGPSSWGRFMDRNAERWDRRRDTRD